MNQDKIKLISRKGDRMEIAIVIGKRSFTRHLQLMDNEWLGVPVWQKPSMDLTIKNKGTQNLRDIKVCNWNEALSHHSISLK